MKQQWTAILVHGNGMRKVLTQTTPSKTEGQAVSVLLQMLRWQTKKKLFGQHTFAIC
jgi:hypothetical protein